MLHLRLTVAKYCSVKQGKPYSASLSTCLQYSKLSALSCLLSSYWLAFKAKDCLRVICTSIALSHYNS